MQKFITLGEGYGDIFEIEALIEYNHARIDRALFLHTENAPSTFLLIMKPVRGNFQAVYTIFKGIHVDETGKGQKYQLLNNWCTEKEIKVIEFTTRNPDDFHEREQFYQYITGVLRLNHLLPPLT
ncbi:DUF7147 family protein [Corticicoccus populi]|uniref:DUF7147 domain-containing protein n=1 Tax=Corticicoccus populi TaxID=1812821 RepID=A0ABW5WUB0_9STAP